MSCQLKSLSAVNVTKGYSITRKFGDCLIHELGIDQESRSVEAPNSCKYRNFYISQNMRSSRARRNHQCSNNLPDFQNFGIFITAMFHNFFLFSRFQTFQILIISEGLIIFCFSQFRSISTFLNFRSTYQTINFFLYHNFQERESNYLMQPYDEGSSDI